MISVRSTLSASIYFFFYINARWSYIDSWVDTWVFTFTIDQNKMTRRAQRTYTILYIYMYVLHTIAVFTHSRASPRVRMFRKTTHFTYIIYLIYFNVRAWWNEDFRTKFWYLFSPFIVSSNVSFFTAYTRYVILYYYACRTPKNVNALSSILSYFEVFWKTLLSWIMIFNWL